MAVTKIWPVRGRLDSLIRYAENQEKTRMPDLTGLAPAKDDLTEVLQYAANHSKTTQDRQLFVSGVNCLPEIARQQMELTKRQFGDTAGIVAFHAYQSFPPGEVTPEECHAIGVELARRLWGDRFQVLVATPLNTDCCHNHCVLNSVSFVDGKLYNECRKTYRALQKASDTLCRVSEIARQQMELTKRQFGDTAGIVAFHAYQSFPPGEVTPEECHAIGVELARRLWGDRFQVLVATHLNTDCCHNHFVLNSISFVDGKRYNDCRKTYRALQKASDTLCREHGLSVVEDPSRHRMTHMPSASKLWANGTPKRPSLIASAKTPCILPSLRGRNGTAGAILRFIPTIGGNRKSSKRPCSKRWASIVPICTIAICWVDCQRRFPTIARPIRPCGRTCATGSRSKPRRPVETGRVQKGPA